MMRPGKNYLNAELRLEANFYNDAGDDTDPDAVACIVLSPYGIKTTYTYGTETNIGKTDTGDFYCDITPDKSGRWFFRWEATGNATTVVNEGNFLVQSSPFDQFSRSY